MPACFARRLTGQLVLITLVSAEVSPGVALAQSAADAATQTGAGSVSPLTESLTGAAKESYEAGVVLFDDGDYAGALLKFQEAYDTSKDPRLLWNMAVCQKQQRHYAKMLPLIESYLSTGAAVTTEQERAQATTVLETLKPFVGRLLLQCNENGASVFVDGDLLGTTPLAAQNIDMGKRQIKVTKPGFVDYVATIQMAGGAPSAVTVTLQPVRHAGHLRITTDVAGDIRIDGTLVGRGQWQGELPSGIHGIEVRAPGMQVYQGDAAVLDDQTNTVRVSLRPIPKQMPAESGTPTWLWVTGGSLLAAGLGLGAYALFKPSEPGTAAPQEGTMEPGVVALP